MKFRLARHTTNLNTITAFYTLIPGMEVLGDFKDHDGYDGIFLGIPGKDWHLEFTVSASLPEHQADEDDLLVFYPDSLEAYKIIKNRFHEHNIPVRPAKNPYWQLNGTTYQDPDGFLIVIAAAGN